ncbi:hypothetical protein DINM_020363 [Dirofilaria immitis]|nr:hypothetical protein [Dirofilaria immitis]
MGKYKGEICILQSSGRSGVCYDKDPDCSDDVCRNYPYTAKERCPKYCGLCHDSSLRSGNRLSSGLSSSYQQSSSSSLPSLKSGITGSTIIKKTNKQMLNYFIIRYHLGVAQATLEVRRSQYSDCNMEICRNFPYTAKERCAKTCGLCSERPPVQELLPWLMFRQKLDCRKEICRDFPFTAKEECAKTCGFCSSDKGMSSSSSSGTAFGTMSPSRHASIHINERDGITGIRSTSPHSILSKEKDLECTDLNTDCTQQICKDYPYTAKERCAKTCGFCRREMTEGDKTSVGGRHSSFTDKQRSRISELDSRDSSLRGIKSSPTTEDCRDEDSQCSEKSCLDRPYTARTKCAKTCGFCGSTVDLEPPLVDSLDKGNIITLDDDVTTRSTATFDRHSTSGIGTPTQSSRHLSVGSRTDSSRKPSLSTHIQQPTRRPFQGVLGRYPGRTGLCADENAYCQKEDCYKYPRFGQRYCEKTCNYC